MELYILSIFLGFCMNTISSFYVRKRAEKLLNEPYKPLPDILHTFLPKINKFIPDYYLFLCICFSLTTCNLINFNSNLLCLGICLVLRSFTVFITIMPTCMPEPKKNKNMYEQLFVSTHDLMFSGHTLFFICLGNIINNLIIQVLGPLLLIMARQHYTIDILASALVYDFFYRRILIYTEL